MLCNSYKAFVIASKLYICYKANLTIIYNILLKSNTMSYIKV